MRPCWPEKTGEGQRQRRGTGRGAPAKAPDLWAGAGPRGGAPERRQPGARGRLCRGVRAQMSTGLVHWRGRWALRPVTGDPQLIFNQAPSPSTQAEFIKHSRPFLQELKGKLLLEQSVSTAPPPPFLPPPPLQALLRHQRQ